ncbi:GIY-YIG nuclease family protein [Aeromonas eucrenophila]|uniref:GIY-YIG nuclease family protein n=1 Tax=Aeromonas eucrenophila TaxID=649 RepID=A0ABW0Y6N0_9GAMM|nr:GIY-YIG nuclease family protein [Aeromonas eucrenophila]
MAKKYEIYFDSYLRDSDKSSIPTESGIYCVYSYLLNTETGKDTIKELIYIGQAEDVNSRLANHEKLEKWKAQLNKGEKLCYSFGAVSKSDLDRCESALIFHHQPPVNIEYKKEFNFPETSIVLTGKTARLTSKFTVEPTIA